VVTLSQLRREQEASPRQLKLLDAREAWIPSAEREGSKSALEAQWLRPDLAKARDRAQVIYQMFLVG
jgi:SH3-like domain-containing protein